MQNFIFKNPTKIIFGKKQIKALNNEVPRDARVLITYGSGSIKKNGVYDQVMAALTGRTVFEFSGIEPNPRYETLLKGIEFVRKEKIDFLLAVGGGSVLDGTKFIAAAVPFKGEPWDIIVKHATINSAVRLASVLTLPATGSEMNGSAVISRNKTREKFSFASPLVYPEFAVLDPEVTFSLPPRQISNGVVDAFVHVCEQYLTTKSNAPLQDRMAEGILTTLIEEGPKALLDPTNYDVRANIMWCCTMALNGLIGRGVAQDWSTHAIGHEITAEYGLDHAQTLAIVLPGVLTVCASDKMEKLLQYGERIWGITTGTNSDRAAKAVQKTIDFFESLNVPTRFSAYGISSDASQRISERFSSRGGCTLGESQKITAETVKKILEQRC